MLKGMKMRILARVGSMLAVVAAVVGGTGGTASAAPPSFYVNVHHSSGAVAMNISGSLAWSTSLRTVTFSAMQLYLKNFEVATVTWQAYQGNTVVDSLILSEVQQSTPIANSSLTSGPGGIDHVVIRLYDVDHVISEYANCYQNASVCQYG